MAEKEAVKLLVSVKKHTIAVDGQSCENMGVRRCLAAIQRFIACW